MDEKLAYYIAVIHQIQPGLSIESAELNDEGLINTVVVVNGEIVFRFARHEAGVQALDQELKVLRAVRPHVDLAVPNPFYADTGKMAYPYLKGQPLTRLILSGLDESHCQAIAEQLGTFLHQLHSVPIDEGLPFTLAPVRYADWLAIRDRVEAEIYPLLMTHQRAWAESLFGALLGDPANFDYPPALIHGDLSCYHILFDPATSQLSAILDFGVAGAGDPANDLALLINYYGAAFVRRFQKVYPDMDDALLRRANFYAQGLEFQWILNGLGSGETFWYTAHLGNARDI